MDDEQLEKLFYCMSLFYKDKWDCLMEKDNRFSKEHKKNMLKIIWKNALTGCSYNEIKNALRHCKQHALTPSHYPPTAIEFFFIAKKKCTLRTAVESTILQPKIDTQPYVNTMIESLKKSPYNAKETRV